MPYYISIQASAGVVNFEATLNVTMQTDNSGGQYLKRGQTFYCREGWMHVGKKCRETDGCCERISSFGCDLDDLELGGMSRVFEVF